jgi:DNA-binding CsgD family transcriptional regulator
MFADHSPATHTNPRHDTAQAYSGPERRTRALGAEWVKERCPWLASMLDEVDYGMLLVDADAQVLHINHSAQHELDSEHPLQLLGRSLRAHLPQDVAPLYDALAGAQRGLRRLLPMGQGAHRICVSVVPVAAGPMAGDGAYGAYGTAQGHAARPGATLLVLGKRDVCARLSVRGFARCHSLTPTETRVLELLCDGASPNCIAQQQGVAVCTVRTQIGSIRAKTGAPSIRGLVRQVAVLPPLVGALRGPGMIAAL